VSDGDEYTVNDDDDGGNDGNDDGYFFFLGSSVDFIWKHPG
jgi:hypothetical protein